MADMVSLTQLAQTTEEEEFLCSLVSWSAVSLLLIVFTLFTLLFRILLYAVFLPLSAAHTHTHTPPWAITHTTHTHLPGQSHTERQTTCTYVSLCAHIRTYISICVR